MAHRVSLEAAYSALLSKKQSEYNSELTIKQWLKQMKALFQSSLTGKLKDYKSDFMNLLKACDENSSMEFFRNIRWVDRSFQSGGNQVSNASTFQKSKITILNLEPSILIDSLDQSRLSNNSFKKFLSIVVHEIKFGKGFFTKLLECFERVFIKKYLSNLSAFDHYCEATKATTKSPFSFLKASFSSMIKLNLSQTPSKSINKTLKSDSDYQQILNCAIEEIKEFRKILIKLLQYQIKKSKNYSHIEWTAEIKRAIFESVNSLLFGWSDQFYISIMNLIGLALSDRQDEFVKQTAIMKHWSTKEFQINTNFRMNGESHAYLAAIEAVNMISQHFTPEDKFKSINAIKAKIIRGVDSYWETHDPKKSMSELVIQVDELLPLFTYLLSRSNGGKLLCDIYFIEQFLDPDNLNYSETSLFFGILHSAIDYILSLTKQRGLSIR